MTKLSKILLCICLSIICICGVVQNTYCGVEDAPPEFYKITLNNTYDMDKIKNSLISPDIYNLYSYRNINIEINSLHLNKSTIFDFAFDEYPDWVNSTINNFNGKLTQIYYPIPSVTSLKYEIIFSIYKWGPSHSYTDWISVNIDKINLIDNSYIFNLDPLTTNTTFGIVTSLVPYFSSSSYGVKQIYSYYEYTFSFDISNSDNYYYANTYNFALAQNKFIKSSGLSLSLCNSNNLHFTESFNETWTNNFKQNNNGNFTFYNNYDSSRSYLKSISISEKFNGTVDVIDDYFYASTYLMSNLISSSDYGSYRYYFSQYNVDNNSDIKNSSTIPIGSNHFYKNAEWYDIPTHLYNFFIYLIFDAPIISNFTKLAMVIINFLVETFNFVIGLFDGVSNVFFISIFVGMLALIFLLKIIFGGKT